MPANFYGSTTYGAGSLYGRVAGSLLSAQDLFHRETALKASITDERSNHWEHFAGSLTNPAGASFKPYGDDPRLQSYAYYRLQNAAVKLTNGNIVRVRVGDGFFTDFAIYTQTITDPTVAAQWTSWTLLYAGTHFGVSIAANGNTAHVYSIKSDGLYRDNVLKWAHDNLMGINPVVGTYDALFIAAVRDDPFEGATHRLMELFYTADIMSAAPVADPTNYRWYSQTINAILLSDGSVLRYQTMPRYDPRALNNGDSITVCKMPSLASNSPTAPRIIRGLAGEVGHNLLRNPRISGPLSDGYYYLFYAEGHRDNDYDLTEGATGSWWQRSKDGIHWSEPIASGVAYGTLIEHSGYAWSIGHEAVSRRFMAPVVYDISNYVPHLNFEIPRANQEGSGELTVANPDGINDALLELSDRRLTIQLGLRVADGSYEYAELNDWWIKRAIKNIDGSANRITIQFGDVWTRLSSALRDNFNFIGQLKWEDFKAGKRNKKFNYFFNSDTAPVDTDGVLVTKGICLYTGWKGQNATAEVHFSAVTGDPAIVFRYLDPKNYQMIQKQGSTLVFIDRVDGVNTELDSGACSSDTSPTLKIIFKWETYEAYVDGALIFSGIYPDQPNVKPGYVGFFGTAYTVSYFTLQDWEPVITSEELIKTALAMGDYHDVSTGETSSEELAIVWGPQTDIPTPADGLRQALTAMKWEMVWMNGRIRVGSFKDLSILKTIDNRIIKTDYVDEASRRINLASVDGNDDPWMEVDVADTQDRDRQISAYFDLPELTDQDSVRARAIEEIRRGKLGRTPGGQVPLYFDLWRMDAVTWIDNAGESNDVRIEGISVEVDQSMTPSQRETLDTSLLNA